jgi:hypothetical protein
MSMSRPPGIESNLRLDTILAPNGLHVTRNMRASGVVRPLFSTMTKFLVSVLACRQFAFVFKESVDPWRLRSSDRASTSDFGDLASTQTFPDCGALMRRVNSLFTWPTLTPVAIEPVRIQLFEQLILYCPMFERAICP